MKMKKICAIVIMLVLLIAGPLFAADTIAVSSTSMSPAAGGKGWGSSFQIVLLCTAAADGTFTSRDITIANIPAKDRYAYYENGYYLLDAWAVNDATTYPGSGAVTITSGGRQLVGTTAGDTLTLSTSASGVAYLSASRGASQRAVTGALNIAVTDTGSAANIFTLYLVLGK
jgi:hypothetical protein